jgi:probable phosphoglycerate mutase
MPNPAEAVLIRHGETAWSLSGQHTGLTDLPLTDNGCRVARLLEEPLAGLGISQVLCSPLMRARQTCALAGYGSVAEIEPDLLEWNYGDYEGLTPEQIRNSRPGWLVFRDGCPGGETPAQIAGRVDRVIQRVRQEEGLVALFAHAHLLRVLAARWLGLTAEQGCHFLLDPATISRLGYYRNSAAIRCWNAAVEKG